MERWKRIKTAPDYDVSSLGKVRHHRKGNIIKASILNFKGHKTYRIKLRVNKRIVTFAVHRLVALAYKRNPFNKREVNHLDGDSLNNVAKNLRWATRSENMLHHYKLRGWRGRSRRSQARTTITIHMIRELAGRYPKLCHKKFIDILIAA